MSRNNSPVSVSGLPMYVDGDTSADESACSAVSVATTSSTSSLISSGTTQSQSSSGCREWIHMVTDTDETSSKHVQLGSSHKSRSNSESSVESFIVLDNEPDAEDEKPLFTVSRPLIIAHDSYVLAGPCATLEPENRADLFGPIEHVFPSPSQDDKCANESISGELTGTTVIESFGGPSDSAQFAASSENSELTLAPVSDDIVQNLVLHALDTSEVAVESNSNVPEAPDASDSGDVSNSLESSCTSESCSNDSEIPDVASTADEPSVLEGSISPCDVDVQRCASNTEDEPSSPNELSVADEPDASASLHADAEDDVDALNELNAIDWLRARLPQPNGWMDFGRCRRIGVVVLAVGVLIGVGLHNASRQNDKLAICKGAPSRNAAADSTIKSLKGQVHTLTQRLRASQLQLRRAHLHNAALRKKARVTKTESITTSAAVHAYDELNSTDPAETQRGNILLPIISEHHPQWILSPVLMQHVDSDPPLTEETQEVAVSVLNESDFGFFDPKNQTATTVLSFDGAAPNATRNANDSAQSVAGSRRTRDAVPVQDSETTTIVKYPEQTQDDHAIAVQRFFAKAQHREKERQLKMKETARLPAWHELRRRRARRSRIWKEPPKVVTFANEVQDREDDNQRFNQEKHTYTYTHAHAHAHAHAYARSDPQHGNEGKADESWIRRCKHCKMPKDRPSHARS